MPRTNPLRFASTIALAAAMSATSVVAQNRDTVETRVSADGGLIVLEWSKKHPWRQDLLRGVTLVAEYQTTSKRLVSEGLGRPATSNRGDANGRVEFRLPDALTTTPESAVCLYFQLSSRAILPIRRADDHDRDTSRFRYEPWEQRATRLSQIAAQQAAVDLTRRKVAAKEQDVATQRRIVARQPAQTVAACEAIAPPAVSTAGRPFDALPAHQHADASRQVCVMRADNGARAGNLLTVTGPGLLETLWQQLPADARADNASLARRSEQLADFRRDWDRFQPGLQAFRRQPQPWFGSFSDDISLQSTMEVPARKLSKREGVTANDVVAYVGGALEAYGRCVTDGAKQLNTKLESWQALSESTALRSGLARQQLVAGCTREVTTLANLEQELAAMQASLARDEAALAADSTIPPLRSGVVRLNTATCPVLESTPPASPTRPPSQRSVSPGRGRR